MESSLVRIKKELKKFISSREIAEATGKEHRNVMADIRTMCNDMDVEIHSANISVEFNTEEVIVVSSVYEVDLGHAKRPAKEFLLNEMAAELLATGYDVKRRYKVLQLIKKLKHAMEKKIAIPDFTNPAEAARAWASEFEAKSIAENKVKELTPKAEVYERISEAENILPLNKVAKSIGIGRNTLMEKLRKDKILMENNNPYQRYINDGYFVVKIKPLSMGGAEVNYAQTFVTGRGLVWLANQVKN
jgi:anti-repressor protein